MAQYDSHLAEGAADLASGAVGVLANGLQGTLQAAKHVKTVAISVPNTVIQTGADVGSIGLHTGAQAADTVARGVNQGFDSVIDHVTELLEQAQHELDEGLHEFANGLPHVG